MSIARKAFRLGNLLIDMNPTWGEKVGPVGLAAACGTICAAVALAFLWAFAHAGLLQGSRWYWYPGFPMLVIAASCGALNGWKDWRRSFDGSSRL